MNHPEPFSASAYEASRAPAPATPYDDDRALAEVIRTELMAAIAKATVAINMLNERYTVAGFEDMDTIRNAAEDYLNSLVHAIESKVGDHMERRADDAAWSDTTRKGAYLMSGV